MHKTNLSVSILCDDFFKSFDCDGFHKKKVTGSLKDQKIRRRSTLCQKKFNPALGLTKRTSFPLSLIQAPGGITSSVVFCWMQILVVSNVSHQRPPGIIPTKNLPWIQQVAISPEIIIYSPWKLDAFLKRSQQKPFRNGEGIPHSHSVYHGRWHHHGGGPGRALAIASEGFGRCKWHRCDTIVHCCQTWANRAGEALIGSTSWCWYLVHQHVLSSVTTCVVTVVFKFYHIYVYIYMGGCPKNGVVV